MNNRIDARVEALAEAIERRKMEQEAPVDDLSRSLFEFGRELVGLDTGDKAELIQSLNEDGLSMSMEDLEVFIADYGVG